MENSPAMFTAAQLRVFLRALINLTPYDYAEDVAAYFLGDNEKNQQTPEEVLTSTLTSRPDEKLTGFALRLALTGHTDIPRENELDLLAEAESAFVPPQPTKKAAAKNAEKAKPITAKPETKPKMTAKKTTVSKKKLQLSQEREPPQFPLPMLQTRRGRIPFGFSRTLIPLV